MKHLKESQDSWAGSNYAYNQTIVPRNTEIFKVNDPISYKCVDCGFDFFTYTNDEEFCTICGSEDIKKNKLIMKLKRFNEDVTDGSVIPPNDDMFQTSIFADIEGDLENMSPGEAEDYLASIITFCNQQIQNIKQ